VRLSGRASRILIFILFCGLIVPVTVHADENHNNNILIGERPAGLGGAYVAVADDPSGLYYNPAGIIYSMGNNLSASVNAWNRVVKHYDDVIGGNGWDRKGYALLPNFFGVIQPLTVGKIGFSYSVPDSIVENQDQIFHDVPSIIPDPAGGNRTIDRYVINFNNDDNTFNFGPSYAVSLSNELSIGATLYVHHRQNEKILNQYLHFDNGVVSTDPLITVNNEYEWTNVYLETTEWGVRPLIGVMYAPQDQKYSLGLTFTKTFVLDSKTTRQQTCKGFDYDMNGDGINDSDTCGADPLQDDAVHVGIDSDEKRDYPYVITLGAAYFPSNSLMFSSDLSYYTATDDDLVGEKRSFINIALGSEYYFTSSVAMRAGFFTNAANTNSIARGRANQPEHVHLYGGSLSLSYFTRGSTLTAGTSYSYGSGEAQIVSGSTRVQDMEMSSLMIFVAASYSY